MAALPIQVAGLWIHPPHLLKYYGTPAFAISHALLLISTILASLGFLAAYSRLARQGGALAMLGFVLTIVTFELLVVLLTFEAFGAPALARDPAARDLLGDGSGSYVNGELGAGGRAVVGFGSVLAALVLGAAILRASVFPRPVARVLIASVPAPILETLVLLPLLGGPRHVIPQEAVPSPLSPLSLGYYLVFLAYAWMGYELWRHHEAIATAA